MLNNKKSKFIFYHFNNYLSQTIETLKLIRHTIISDDVLASGALQERNWPYFIEWLLQFTNQQEVEIDCLEGLGTIEEIQIISESIENITIYKEVYNNLLNVAVDCIHDYFNYIESKKLKEIEKGLMLNYFFINFNNRQNAYQIIRAHSHFFYELGRFPGDQNQAVAPQGNISSFINTTNIISPNDLYKKFGATDVYGLVSVHFLAPFNRYLGSRIDISNDAMTKIFHNLSMQA